MSDEFEDELAESEPWEEEYVSDHYVGEAEDVLFALINENPDKVYYERQLQVRFEKDFYHWITSRALDELVDQKIIQSDTLPMKLGKQRGAEGRAASAKIRFFFSNKLRYWKRKANATLKIVSAYSEPGFTRGLGRQAEMLFDAALPKEGFIPVAENVREYEGRKWEESEHDLDRIFVRDGVAYGAEIKNKLAYIDGKEFTTKLRMCRHLRLRPLFIARMMPKAYITTVHRNGGFSLIFKYQLYPFGAENLARTVRRKLELPVDCPAAIERGTIKRFLKWHERHLPA